MKFNELDVVKVLVDLAAEDIRAGEIGTVICAFRKPYEAYDVEFVQPDGSTKAIAAFAPEQLELVTPWNISAEPEAILARLARMLEEVGFQKTEVNGNITYQYRDLFCRPDYAPRIGFLIEYASSREEAEKNWYADGDRVWEDLAADQIVHILKKEVLAQLRDLPEDPGMRKKGKEAPGMLFWDESLHLANIMVALHEVWNGKAIVEKVEIAAGRSGVMQIDVGIELHVRPRIRLEYERSFLNIFILCEDRYVFLGHLMPLPQIECFQDCQMANLLSRFRLVKSFLENGGEGKVRTEKSVRSPIDLRDFLRILRVKTLPTGETVCRVSDLMQLLKLSQQEIYIHEDALFTPFYFDGKRVMELYAHVMFLHRTEQADFEAYLLKKTGRARIEDVPEKIRQLHSICYAPILAENPYLSWERLRAYLDFILEAAPKEYAIEDAFGSFNPENLWVELF